MSKEQKTQFKKTNKSMMDTAIAHLDAFTSLSDITEKAAPQAIQQQEFVDSHRPFFTHDLEKLIHQDKPPSFKDKSIASLVKLASQPTKSFELPVELKVKTETETMLFQLIAQDVLVTVKPLAPFFSIFNSVTSDVLDCQASIYIYI